MAVVLCCAVFVLCCFLGGLFRFVFPLLFRACFCQQKLKVCLCVVPVCVCAVARVGETSLCFGHMLFFPLSSPSVSCDSATLQRAGELTLIVANS